MLSDTHDTTQILAGNAAAITRTWAVCRLAGDAAKVLDAIDDGLVAGPRKVTADDFVTLTERVEFIRVDSGLIVGGCQVSIEAVAELWVVCRHMGSNLLDSTSHWDGFTSWCDFDLPSEFFHAVAL